MKQIKKESGGFLAGRPKRSCFEFGGIAGSGPASGIPAAAVGRPRPRVAAWDGRGGKRGATPATEATPGAPALVPAATGGRFRRPRARRGAQGVNDGSALSFKGLTRDRVNTAGEGWGGCSGHMMQK